VEGPRGPWECFETSNSFTGPSCVRTQIHVHWILTKCSSKAYMAHMFMFITFY